METDTLVRRARAAAMLGLVAAFGCSDEETNPTGAGSTETSTSTSAATGGGGATSSTASGMGGATGGGGASSASAAGGAGGSGGMMGAGGAGGMSATCLDCATMSCATQLAACQADADCLCTFDCVAAGGAEGGCKQMCNLDPQNAAWGPMVDCLDMSCQNDC